MEKKDLEKIINYNIETINSLWRSLWHRFQKTKSKRFRTNYCKPKFLE